MLSDCCVPCIPREVQHVLQPSSEVSVTCSHVLFYGPSSDLLSSGQQQSCPCMHPHSAAGTGGSKVAHPVISRMPLLDCCCCCAGKRSSDGDPLHQQQQLTAQREQQQQHQRRRSSCRRSASSCYPATGLLPRLRLSFPASKTASARLAVGPQLRPLTLVRSLDMSVAKEDVVKIVIKAIGSQVLVSLYMNHTH